MDKMTQISKDHLPREDEHHIKFDDNRNFAAVRWTTAEEAQEISAADRAKARNVPDYEEFGNWIRRTIQDQQHPQQRSSLQTVLPLARPLFGFITSFENLVAPEKVDTSILWGLVYINVHLAVSSQETLKRIAVWVKSLRQSLEQFNQCVDNCEEENTARSQMTDIFEPLLNVLTSLIRFQRTYTTGKPDAQFTRYYGLVKETVEPYITEIDDVISHFRQITMHSRARAEGLASRHHQRGLPFRNVYDDCTAFPVRHLPDIRTEQFFGREEPIDRIHKHLGNQSDAKLRTYLIYGRRGVGKTQIALEYARRYQSHFDAVFWVRCETSAALRQSFTDIAVALELPGANKTGHFEENQMLVLEWLKKTDKTWLLVYDNAERGRSLNAYWPREACGSILLTSRSYYNFEGQEQRDGETIEVFTEDERWHLLMELLGDQWQLQHSGGPQGALEQAAAKKLLEITGGLALAIAQAAKLILDTKVTGDQSVVTLLKRFEEARRKLPPRLSGHRDALIQSLDTIWSISLNVLSDNARSLLGVFSLLAPDDILIDLFLPGNQARLDGRLEFCKQEDPTIPAVEMTKAMQAAVTELKVAGFIQQDRRVFIIHRVIQEAMNYMDINDLQDSFNAATNILHEAFPLRLKGQPLHNVWSRCQLYVQHVVHLSKAFVTYRRGRHGLINAELNFVRVLSNCGWYLYEVADYEECLNMMDVARNAPNEKDLLLYSDILSINAAVRYETNRLKKARIDFQEVRKIREQYLEPADLQIAMVYADIGNIESAEGNFDEALELFEKAARIREQHGDSQVVMLGLTFLQIGRVWFLRGDSYHAIKSYDRAESCFMRKTGDQVFLAHLQYARGNLYFYESRDLTQATSHYEKCRDVCNKLQPAHPLTVAVLYKLGCVEAAKGKRSYDRALNYFEKAFNIADIRSPGDVDGTIARILWKKSEVLIDDGQFRRPEGMKLRDEMLVARDDIAGELGLTVDLAQDLSEEQRFDMLVPGYFR